MLGFPATAPPGIAGLCQNEGFGLQARRPLCVYAPVCVQRTGRRRQAKSSEKGYVCLSLSIRSSYIISSCVITVGGLCCRLDRRGAISPSCGLCRTSRYRKTIAFNAWLWVEAATLPSVTKLDKNPFNILNAKLSWEVFP